MTSTYPHLLKPSTSSMCATFRTVLPQVFILILVGFTTFSLFTSCVEQAFPTNMYTQEQFNKSPRAKEGAFWAIPSTIVQPIGYHWRFGWGGVMHARDVMTGDYTSPYQDYDPFVAFSQCTGLAKDDDIADFMYMSYYNVILAANISIKGFVSNESSLSDAEKGLLGASYAFRALSYLELAGMYEFLPNEKFPDGRNAQGNLITNLTVPIVTEKLKQKDSYNNPRATHKQMFDFILSDLDKAEKNIQFINIETKDVPHLDVVYGLKARLYLWDGQYENAAIFARKAIETHTGSPLTQEEWHNAVSGFNTPTVGSWMLSASVNKETLGTSFNFSNWTGWMSAEAQFGYAGLGKVYPSIDRSLYDKIANTDFRKLSFKAPEGHPLEGKTIYIDNEIGASLPPLTSVKFRAAQGNTATHTIGAVCSYPLMRIEEMYFIEAEAMAHTNPAKGLELLNSFMKNYRDPQYNCTSTESRALVEEIILQKRIELWGEGRTFFDIKRLNLSVVRAYDGTNVPSPVRYNTNGRPAWTNLVFPKYEGVYNRAVTYYNNPDPSEKYKAIRE